MGCRRRAHPDELVRFVFSGHEITPGRNGKGRGAWLCAASPACLELASKRGAFSRAFRAAVPAAVIAKAAPELLRPQHTSP
ncbi:MAG: YlxR family protein [Acidimicrobiales bacterium]